MQSTRRDFFKHLFENVQENIQKTAIFSLLPVKNEQKIEIKDSWICLGQISDFPVGQNFEVNNGEQILISTDEGLFVVSKDTFKNDKREPRLLIKMGERGLIQMNTQEEIPERTVLSIMTGELIPEEVF